MAIDVKEMLEELNPSQKAMRYIIVILVTVITALIGLLGYNKLFNSDDDNSKNNETTLIILKNYDNQIIGLKQNIHSLVIALKTQENKYQDMKTYFDKRIVFIVENQDSKNKKFILSVLDMTKTMETKPVEPVEPIEEAPVLESISHKDSEIIIEEKPVIKEIINIIQQDTVVTKPGLIKRFINWL